MVGWRTNGPLGIGETATVQLYDAMERLSEKDLWEWVAPLAFDPNHLGRGALDRVDEELESIAEQVPVSDSLRRVVRLARTVSDHCDKIRRSLSEIPNDRDLHV